MDAPMERLLRHVIAAMNPLEVWLFGSRAESRARLTSDYDLIVVMPDETPEFELDPVRAWRLGWEARVTADIIPCTRSEFDEGIAECIVTQERACGANVFVGSEVHALARKSGSLRERLRPRLLPRVATREVVNASGADTR